MNTTNATKQWFLSKTVIGGVVALIAGVVGISETDAAQLTDLITNAFSIGGGILAIYGRVVATKNLTLASRTK